MQNYISILNTTKENKSLIKSANNSTLKNKYNALVLSLIDTDYPLKTLQANTALMELVLNELQERESKIDGARWSIKIDKF